MICLPLSFLFQSSYSGCKLGLKDTRQNRKFWCLELNRSSKMKILNWHNISIIQVWNQKATRGLSWVLSWQMFYQKMIGCALWIIWLSTMNNLSSSSTSPYLSCFHLEASFFRQPMSKIVKLLSNLKSPSVSKSCGL